MKIKSMYAALCHAVLAISIGLSPATSYAQATSPSADIKTTLAAGETGKITFNSAHPKATYARLISQKAPFNTPITGELLLPPGVGKDAKVSAMVIMHSSSGINPTIYEWAEYLRKMGVATFVVDSFTARGIARTAGDQSQMGHPATVADGLKALQILATHPNIDAGKIGIIGFSKGGFGALATSFERLRAAVVPGDLKYALHISFYGGCHESAKTTGSPIVMLIGDKDGYFSTQSCQANVDALKKKGANVKLIVYPGALHGFDIPKPHKYARDVQTWINCPPVVIDLDADEIHGADGTIQSLSQNVGRKDDCMSTGVTLGGDSSARERSMKEVKDLVVQTFGLVAK